MACIGDEGAFVCTCARDPECDEAPYAGAYGVCPLQAPPPTATPAPSATPAPTATATGAIATAAPVGAATSGAAVISAVGALLMAALAFLLHV